MISVLTQERLLGFALGSAFMAGVVFENRKSIHKLVSESDSAFGGQLSIQKPIVEKKSGLDVGHYWNKAVEETFRPIIKSLSSSGW
ncbi:hypothetical protein V2J09_008437 [Rumex salicifolius]